MSLLHIASISLKWKMIKNTKMHKMKITQMTKNMSKNSEKRGGLISALKPGPVVPPGIEKAPNQAARISQSVKKCHLSDILAFFRGGRFLTLFSHFFTFPFLAFYHFSVFLILSLFTLFWFLHFYSFLILLIFDHFLSFFLSMTNFCHFLCLN